MKSCRVALSCSFVIASLISGAVAAKPAKPAVPAPVLTWRFVEKQVDEGQKDVEWTLLADSQVIYSAKSSWVLRCAELKVGEKNRPKGALTSAMCDHENAAEFFAVFQKGKELVLRARTDESITTGRWRDLKILDIPGR